MIVDDALIDKLARLSMLQFNEAEKEAIKQDLQKMIGFVNKLSELDTSGTQPLQHMGEAMNAFREDVSSNTLERAAALSNAPNHDSQYIKVPKVIKK
jgi:aspartyl-tRNA(Asn)/glutamyl-tRNA(Gln) amidotransferase subunit C